MSTKTGYKTAPQQRYRIHQGTHAFLKLEFSTEKESSEAIVDRCTAHLQEELQLKSVFYVDEEKGFVLQQYAEKARIQFGQIEVENDTEIPDSISQAEKELLGWEEGAIANVRFYIQKDHVIITLATFSCVFDESSLGLLAKELIKSEKATEGEISYLQYANWQSQLIEENGGTQSQASARENKSKHGAQWIYPIKKATTSNYKKETFNIEESVQSQLSQLTKDLEVNVETIYLAAFAVCCYRLNRSENASFGFTNDGRYFDEIKRLKGVLAKTFPFFVEISGELSWQELLKVSQHEFDAHQEMHANFEEQKEHASEIQFVIRDDNGLEADWYSPSDSFSLRYEASSKTHAIRYNEEVISKQFVEDVKITLQSLLKQLGENPSSKISRATFGKDGTRVITSKREYSVAQPKTLSELFQQVFTTHKDEIAISNEKASYTYSELSSMVNQVAHFVSPFTQTSGEGIAVLVNQEADLPAILMGIWMRGGYYIPIPADCPEERLKEILNDSGAKVLLTNRLDLGAMNVPVVHWSLNMWNKSWNQESTWMERTSESPAYMIYTSGTSGKPKGVKVPDSALINYTHWLKEEFNIGKGAVSSMLSSYAFDLVYTAFWGALCNGGTLCIPSSEIVLNAEKLVDHIIDEQLTFVKLTPSHLKIIKEAGNLDKLKDAKLNYLFLGGEPIQVEDVKLVKELLPNCKIINHYGPTETTIGVVFTELPNNLEDYATQPWIGKPIANTTAFILNKENQPLGMGQVGELGISGRSLSLGYHNRAILNQEKFIEIEVGGQSNKVYKTGDLAYCDYQGQIVLLGRSDNQVKINGHRIEPSEIQKSILAADTSVEECYVLVGEVNGIQRLLAFVKTSSTETEEWQERLKKHLPEYMIPEFVLVDTIPLTGNGKVDQKVLLAFYQEGSQQKEIVQPETDLEQEFVRVWKEVLKLEEISVVDNFFELGGDSIRAIQLVSRLIKKGYKVEVRDLFEFSDIRSLATFYETNVAQHDEKKKLIPEQKAFALSPLQEGMFYLSLTDDKRSHYIQREFDFSGNFDVNHFSKVIQEASKVFPILRARFFMSDDQTPRQEFAEERETPIQIHRLNGQSEEEVLKEIELAKEAQLEKGLDLSEDPLFAVDIWQLNTQTYRLLLSYHHIILDGWCFQIIASKIIEAYYTGTPISDDDAPPYSKFIEWIQSRKQGSDLAFWEDYLKNYSGTTQLKDYLVASNEEVNYLHQTSEGVISKEIFKAFKVFCKEQRLTQGFVLQQIWGLLLSKYTSREDVVFATTVSGRPPELEGSENMVGLFINTLPYRVLFEAESSCISWLKKSSTDYPEWLSNQFVRLSEVQSLTASKENLLKHLFVLENYPLRSSSALADDKTELDIEQKGGEIHLNYDLSLVLHPEDDLKIQWIYNGNAYRRSFVEQLNLHFGRLIQQIIQNPELLLKEVQLTEQTLSSESINAIEETKASQFLDRLENNLSQYQNNIAVKTASKAITYQELNEQSNRIKLTLLSKFEKGSAVGVYMMPDIELVVVILGMLRAGITYVPLDPKQAKLRLQNIVEDAEISAIICEERDNQKAGELFEDQKILTVHSLMNIATDKEISVEVTDDDEVYRIFTSGSTGRPKGCCIQHKHLLHLFDGTSHHFDFRSDDRWILLHSFGFDFSVWEIWGALWNGASVYIPKENTAGNPEKLKTILTQEKITILNSTPGAFYALIDTEHTVANWEKTIRYVVFGGDKLEPHRFQDWYNTKQPDHLKLINMYGITETTVHVTYKEITSEDIFSSQKLSPIGDGFTGVQVHCYDPYLNELPQGIVGELFVGGGGVSKGYYGQSELSNKVFIQHPKNPKERLYKSGDLGFKDEHGEFFYIGRKDRQVQIRGFRIELEEIKRAFLQHLSIKDVGLVKKDGKTIEEDRIEAFYTLKEDGQKIHNTDLRTFLSDRISWYMIPAVLTPVTEIPLTANGKFDPSAIVKVLGDENRQQQNATYTEYEIIRIWRELLQTENIELDDDFFDLGGNSLLAIRFITELNKKLQSHIDVGEVFRQRTVRLLAKYIESGDITKFTSPYQVFNSGKATKVFFFPPALAFGFVFGRLASELKDHEIITFNYIDEGDTLLQYTKIMHELQPSGDFVLAGFSSGGSLAFEVAKVLEKKGRKVSNIVLLDSRMNKTGEFLSEKQCSEIADNFLNDPRADQYISGEKQKRIMWQTIKKCAKFIHALENTGTIQATIHLITSDVNHENTERIGYWIESTKGDFKQYRGKGKHDEMLDPQNFELNKKHFKAILDQL